MSPREILIARFRALELPREDAERCADHTLLELEASGFRFIEQGNPSVTAKQPKPPVASITVTYQPLDGHLLGVMRPITSLDRGNVAVAALDAVSTILMELSKR